MWLAIKSGDWFFRNWKNKINKNIFEKQKKQSTVDGQRSKAENRRPLTVDRGRGPSTVI
jgi:hypothetical protein